MSNGGILSRYVLVLEAIAAAPEGLSLTETISATGLPRGTVHRLLGALLKVGLLAAREGRKVYVLGPRLNRLLHLSAGSPSVASCVRPTLARLVERFGETAFLARLAGERVESLCTIVPDHERQSHVRPGRVMPMHAAASAKAIFAFQDDALLDKILAEPRQQFTPRTRVDEAQVRADLARVRRAGYATCVNELDPGVLSYAVPIRMERLGVLYSVGLVGLEQRVANHAEADLVAALRGAADELTGLLSSELPRVVAAGEAEFRLAAGAVE